MRTHARNYPFTSMICDFDAGLIIVQIEAPV
jgi:hypothetical protein